MKYTCRTGSKSKLSLLALSTLASLAIVSLGQAQIITLSDQNSIVQVNTAGSSGMFNWFVDGNDYLAQQWFWFRVGTVGPEAPINTISAPSITTPNARTLYSSYNNGAYGVEVDYTLTGFSPASGLSHVDEIITLTNGTAAPLDFHFFQYSDFDLGPGGDTVNLNKSLSGQFKGADQQGGAGHFVESVVTPPANHGEAATFPFTLNRLNDGLPTTLNDSTNAGPGDVSWALEWDFTIDPFSSLGISKIKDLNVPEPSAITLISVGAVAIVWRKRGKNRI